MGYLMGDYFLRRNALSHPAKVEITAEQFEDISCASRIQLESLYIEQKYDFVVENYLEFEETILRCGLNHMILGFVDRQSLNADTALFNRRIMNLLTAYKTYDDTYLQHVNRIFNRDREMIRSVKKPFSEEYDGRVGYWMIPKIRNYVQHQGFPMHGSAYTAGWCKNSEGKDRNRYTIDLYIDPVELSEGKFNSEVRSRLLAMNTKIDLKFLIRDFMEGFSVAHDQGRQLLGDRIGWAVDFTDSATELFLKDSGYSTALALTAFSPNGNVSVATYANEQRKYLVKKNGRLANLSKRFISNEVESDSAEE